MLSVCQCMCLDVNQGGTNRNCCTEICNLACTKLLGIWGFLFCAILMNADRTSKLGQSDLLYRSKLLAEKK